MVIDIMGTIKETLKFLKNFYHLTDINNLDTILQDGILSRERIINNYSYDFIDLSNKDIQRKRKDLHSYVPLFFADNTPLLYRILTNHDPETSVLLEIDKHIFFLKDGVLFSNINAAKNDAEIYSDWKALDQLDWNIIYERKSAMSFYRKGIRSAEVLIPNIIEPKWIEKIHFWSDCSQENYKFLRKIVSKAGYDPDEKIELDLTLKGIR